MTQVAPAPAGTAIGANGAENKASGDMITTIPISSARLVKHGDDEHSGAWEKGVMLRVELERSIPAADMPVLEILGDVGRYGPMLAIQGTGQFAVFSGLWAILSVDAPRKTVLCHVPMYEGDEYAAKVKYAVEPPPTRKGRNVIVVRAPETVDAADSASMAFIAPPLTFHARMSVFYIDNIDTVGQTFRVDSYLELRLRAIAHEQDDELIGSLLSAFGFRTDMVEMMNVVESVRDPEVWGNFADGITQGLVDYCIKLRTHNVIAEEYELQDFPFDTQPLTLLVTVNIPITRAVIIGNEQYPSLFFHKAFQQKSVYDIVFKEQLHWELQQSEASESSAGFIYPRIMFSLSLRRRSGYYMTNVALPIGVLTASTAVLRPNARVLVRSVYWRPTCAPSDQRT